MPTKTQFSSEETKQSRTYTNAFFNSLNYVHVYSDGIGFGKTTFRLSNAPRNLKKLYEISTSGFLWLASMAISIGVKASEYNSYYFNDTEGNQGRIDLNKDTSVDFGGCPTSVPHSIENGVVQGLLSCNITFNELANDNYGLVEQFFPYQHESPTYAGPLVGNSGCDPSRLTDYLAIFYNNLQSNFSEEFINCLRNIITENYDAASIQKLKENQEIGKGILIGIGALIGCGVCFCVLRCVRETTCTCESNNYTRSTKEKQYEKVQNQDIAIEMKELRRENRLLKMQVEGISSEEKKLREKTKKKKEKILLLEEGEGEGERSSSEDEVPLLDPREVRTIEKLKEENELLRRENEELKKTSVSIYQNRDYEKLQKSLEQLQQEKSDQTQLLESLQKENEMLKKQNEMMKEKNNQLKLEKQNADKRYQSTYAMLQNAFKENKKKDSQLKVAEQESERHKQESERHQQESEKHKKASEKKDEALHEKELQYQIALEDGVKKEEKIEELSGQLDKTEKQARELTGKDEHNRKAFKGLKRVLKDEYGKSWEVMEDPVVLQSGHTYERKDIRVEYKISEPLMPNVDRSMILSRFSVVSIDTFTGADEE